MKHVMLDIETLDTAPSAALLSIGAVSFNDREVLSMFYGVVTLDSAMQHGTVSADVLRFWMKQGDAARNVFSDAALPLEEVLRRFGVWFSTENPVDIWANGAAFDFPILSGAYAKLGIKRPWTYKDERCFRTLRHLCPQMPVPHHRGTAHNALDDATWQAEAMITYFKR